MSLFAPKIIHGWQSHDRKANKKRSFVALAKKGCAQKIETACRISGRGADRRRRRFWSIALQLTGTFSLVSPALLRYALCLGTVLFRPVSYRSVPLRPALCFFRIALFLSGVRLMSAPFIFNLRLIFPKGRYRAASFLSVSPDPALFRVALYLVPHRPIPSSSVAPCSVYSHSVSSAPHFPRFVSHSPVSSFEFSRASFRTGLYSSILHSFLFYLFGFSISARGSVPHFFSVNPESAGGFCFFRKLDVRYSEKSFFRKIFKKIL